MNETTNAKEFRDDETQTDNLNKLTIYKLLKLPKFKDMLKMQKSMSVESNKGLNEKDEYALEKPLVADGGFRAWLVCVATMWSYGIIMGNEFNYGLIYEKFVVVYNGTPNHITYAGWIGSLELGFESLCYLPAAICIDFFGIQKSAITGTIFQTLALLTSAFITKMPIYFLTEGIMLGIGQAFLTESTYSILPHYFEKRLGLANGLMNLGASFVTIGLMITTSRILKNLGLLYSFLILSAISFTSIISSFTFISVLKPDHKSETVYGKLKESFGIKVLKKPEFLVWGISSFIGLFGTKIPPVTINHLATVLFPEQTNTEMLNVIFTASTGLSGVIFGKLLDYTKFSNIYYHTMAFMIFGGIQLALIHAPNFTALVALYGVYGIGNGIFFACFMPVAVEVSGSPTLGAQAIGLYFLFAAVPYICGPLIASNLYQNLGTYDISYYFGSGMCFFCCLIQSLYPSGFIMRTIRRVFSKDENKMFAF